VTLTTHQQREVSPEMITSTTVTEPLRAEHRALRPQRAELANAAASVWGWDATQASDRLRKIVAFLQYHLVPHAAAEEAVLYPAIEAAMGAPGATATMQADHIEIMARSERLAATVDAAAERWPDPAVVDDIAIQLAGLSAIIELPSARRRTCCCPCSTGPSAPRTPMRCSPGWATPPTADEPRRRPRRARPGVCRAAGGDRPRARPRRGRPGPSARQHQAAGASDRRRRGHIDRVARISADLPPTVTVAGAAYGGVGIPDCIRQGREAGSQILAALGARC
jgi:hypothetical protein